MKDPTDERVISFNFVGGEPPNVEPVALLMTPEEALLEGERQLIFTGPSEHGWHRISVFLRCPALYDALYVSKTITEGQASNDYLTRGTLVHIGLAHHYLRAGIVQRKGLLHDGEVRKNADDYYTPMAALTLAAVKLDGMGDRHALRLLPLTQAILKRYLTLMAGSSMDRGVKVYAVEQVGTLNCGGFPFTARFDLVVEAPDGILIWDHKILARPKEAANMYSHSGQIHGHRALGTALWGDKFRGSKLNAIPADPQSKVGVHRVTPHAAPGMVAALPQVVYDTQSQIGFLKQNRKPGNWPRTMQCVDKFQGLCPAWEQCIGSKK